MRIVPVPSWAKSTVDAWKTVAHLEDEFVFRRGNKGGNLMGEGMTEQAIYNIVVSHAEKLEKQGYRAARSPAHVREARAQRRIFH